MSKTKQLLTLIENAIRSGALTKARRIDSETFVCLTEETPEGKNYHQLAFESMPQSFQDALRYQIVGAKVQNLKVIAIFDMWPEALEEEEKMNLTKTLLAC